jgi:homoserine kinase type II
MIPSNLNLVARSVLSEYALADTELAPLGNRGGFSGAALWRVKQANGDLCLRAWPIAGISEERLLEIQHLMELARDNGLTFIPAVLTTSAGSRFVKQADRVWEVSSWMPGIAATPTRVTRTQIQGTFTALARLHAAWAAVGSDRGPCPGIRRRLEAVREWDERVQPALRSPRLPGFRQRTGADPATPWAERAAQLLQIHAANIPVKLGAWIDPFLPLQSCLCDIWHDHVLFEGDVVTGLVDFGGVKLDHVAVDLARLLGSLVEDRAELRSAGLEAYSRIRPLSLEEEQLVSVLDETGTLVGLVTWLKWLYVDDKPFDDRSSAARRLQALVDRVERW